MGKTSGKDKLPSDIYCTFTHTKVAKCYYIYTWVNINSIESKDMIMSVSTAIFSPISGQ